MVSKVGPFPIIDLNWSLKPLIGWTKLIAVLAFPANREHLISLLHRYLAWILTVVAHVSLMCTFLYCDNVTFFATKGTDAAGHATFSWVLFINYANKTVHSIGIHTVIVFLLAGRWNDLWFSLECTVNRLGLYQLPYSSLQRWSWMAVIYIILSV